MLNKLVKKTKFKIFAATAVTIFTLGSTISASFAWFDAVLSRRVTAGNFEIAATGSCGIDNVRLIKFTYGSSTYGSFTTIDYLTPETGHVNSYDYNYGTHSFGVNAMNPYDPVDRIVRGTSLKDLNCNAVYEVSFVSSQVGLTYFELSSSIFSVIKDKDADILLSDCVDIDIFYEDDLDDDNSLFINEDDVGTALVNEYDDKLYYPSYKISNLNKYYTWNGSSWDQSNSAPTGDVTDMGTVKYADYLPESPNTGDYYKVLKTLSVLGEDAQEIADAGIYYKLSYLSSLKAENAHSHFYGNPKATSISIVEDKQITFTDGVPVKFYINVNYAPSIADKFMKDIYLNDIVAKYDYGFKFEFLESPRG